MVLRKGILLGIWRGKWVALGRKLFQVRFSFALFARLILERREIIVPCSYGTLVERRAQSADEVSFSPSLCVFNLSHIRGRRRSYIFCRD